MTDLFELDAAYSTTRRVRKVAPDVVKAELKTAQETDDQFETILFLPEGEGRNGEGGLRAKGYFKKNSEKKPLITIITVVFNGEQHLEKTIVSVINQSYENIEYIIIDGGSNDATIDIIKKYEGAIDYWVSERDGGIYNAMNAGIKLSTGTLVGLINSDDYYMPESISLMACLCKRSKSDIIFGQKLLKNERLKLQKVVGVRVPQYLKDVSVNRVHPSVFVKRNVYKKIVFDEKYKIAADYDFFLRVFLEGYRFEKIKEVISVMRTGGASSAFHLEGFKIINRRLGKTYAFLFLFKKIVLKFSSTLLALMPSKIKRARCLSKGWASYE